MIGPEENIINPQRAKGEPVLPATGLFCLNPGDAVYLGQKAKECGGRHHFLFNSHLKVISEAEGEQPLFVAGPAVGAPMAVMTLEKLIALGCRRVVTWGWCGALASNLRLGDLVVPATGFSEEGTSQHYRIGAGADDGSREWRRRIEAYLADAGLKVRAGAVWSTDAPYRETKAKVEDYAARGALAVEMEFTALAAVAAYRHIELAAVLIVSDELWRAPWCPGFQHRDFKRKNRLVLEGLFDWLRKFNG